MEELEGETHVAGGNIFWGGKRTHGAFMKKPVVGKKVRISAKEYTPIGEAKRRLFRYIGDEDGEFLDKELSDGRKVVEELEDLLSFTDHIRFMNMDLFAEVIMFYYNYQEKEKT